MGAPLWGGKMPPTYSQTDAPPEHHRIEAPHCLCEGHGVLGTGVDLANWTGHS